MLNFAVSINVLFGGLIGLTFIAEGWFPRLSLFYLLDKKGRITAAAALHIITNIIKSACLHY